MTDKVVDVIDDRAGDGLLMGLSRMECSVVALMAHGNSKDDAAEWLGVTRKRVNEVLKSAMTKTGATDLGSLVEIYRTNWKSCPQ